MILTQSCCEYQITSFFTKSKFSAAVYLNVNIVFPLRMAKVEIPQCSRITYSAINTCCYCVMTSIQFVSALVILFLNNHKGHLPTCQQQKPSEQDKITGLINPNFTRQSKL